MARRTALLPLALAMGAVVVIALGVITGRLIEASTAPGVADAGYAGVGGPFTLQDGDGHTVRDTDFRGRWMLLYFGYTHCPDACPTTLSSMIRALQDLGPQAASVQPVFITVDPARDDGKTMKDYAAAFDPRLVGLTGSEDAVTAAAHAYRVYFAKHMDADGKDYSMDHSSIVYAIDPQGRTVGFFGQETTPEAMAVRLKGWITGAAPARSAS